MSAVIVTIAGGSGSGKTTLATGLATELSDLKPVVLAQDRYFRDFEEYEPEVQDRIRTANRPDAVNWASFYEALGQLMAGGRIREPAPGTRASARGIPTTFLGPAGVIIVEGLFALWDEQCRELSYLRLYTEVDEDERILRRLERDVATRGISLPEAVAWYRRELRRTIAVTPLPADAMPTWWFPPRRTAYPDNEPLPTPCEPNGPAGRRRATRSETRGGRMPAKIQVALIGLDHWYTVLGLAESIASRDDIAMAGIADSDIDRATETAHRFGVDRVEAQWEKLVEDPGVDAVASFVSSEQNPEVCIAAAQAGKHVLSIKPLARTLDDASRVVAAVREAGISFLPAETRHRVSEQSTTLRRWLDEGRFGRLISGSFSLWASLPQRWPGDKNPGWFADPARTVGGSWVDHSIYQLDLLRFLLGEEVASISGQVANLCHDGLPVEDWGVATVAFTGDARAILEDTWTATGGMFQQSMMLVGTEGAVRVDGIQGRMLLLGGLASPFSGWVEVKPLARYGNGIDSWLALIRGEAEPAATVEDAWRNLAACTAFYEAARTGQTVVPNNL